MISVLLSFSLFAVLLDKNLLLPEQHMREVAERRQQLELEHEQALAILKFKQDEIKRLQRVRTTASFVLYIFDKYLYCLNQTLMSPRLLSA